MNRGLVRSLLKLSAVVACALAVAFVSVGCAKKNCKPCPKSAQSTEVKKEEPKKEEAKKTEPVKKEEPKKP